MCSVFNYVFVPCLQDNISNINYTICRPSSLIYILSLINIYSLLQTGRYTWIHFMGNVILLQGFFETKNISFSLLFSRAVAQSVRAFALHAKG